MFFVVVIVQTVQDNDLKFGEMFQQVNALVLSPAIVFLNFSVA